jgi:hypothetical protein
MFRITWNPSSGSLVQCMAKNYKNDSIVSVDMDRVSDHLVGDPTHVGALLNIL